MEILFLIIVWALLGLIPAYIAKNKGYNFGLWWFYGFMIWIVAFIHSLCLKDKNAPAANTYSYAPPVQQTKDSASVAQELKMFKELLDSGAITEEEYRIKKEQLLRKM